jgi:hypothetical protein
MQKATCNQARAPDAGAAMDGNCDASKQLAMQLDKQRRELSHGLGGAPISDGKRMEAEPKLPAERSLLLELKLADFRCLQQRDDDANACGLPGGDVGAKVLAATRARRESEPVRLDAGYPVERCLKHSEGI